MTPELQNELRLIQEALETCPESTLTQNAKRALELVSEQLQPFGYETCYPLRACIWRRRDEWVLELSGEINDTSFTVRHPQPGYIPPEDVVNLRQPSEGSDNPVAGTLEAKLECCRSILGPDVQLTPEEVEKVISLNRNYWDGWVANRTPENVVHNELKTFLSKRDQGRVMGVLRAKGMVYDPRDAQENGVPPRYTLQPIGEIVSSVILEAQGDMECRIPQVDFNKHDLPIGTVLYAEKKV